MFDNDNSITRLLLAGLLFLIVLQIINGCGTAGKQGRPGPEGRAGQNCLVTPTANGSAIKCADGSYTEVTNGVDGTDGAQGEPGIQGAKGNTGDIGGVGPQGPQGDVGPQGIPGRDGQDGEDGEDALLPGDAVVQVIDPCGQETAHDEVILKTVDGRFFAYFEENGKRRLAILSEDTQYETTDGTGCRFIIHNGEII